MAEIERKILVTGPAGQIGSELVPALQERHGKDNVVALVHEHTPVGYDGPSASGDAQDFEGMKKIVDEHNIGVIYHLASLLSAKGEENPLLTFQVNMSIVNVLQIAREKNLRVFWPSSIAVSGETTPRDNMPQHTILEPSRNIYGPTKVAGELLSGYFHRQHGVDVRSVRYPGLISWKTEPGGGTTDYAVAIFYEALKRGEYECFVTEDTVLSMMYMDDAIRGTLQLMDADLSGVERFQSYNMGAMSFSAGELAQEIRKHIPNLKVTYKPDPQKQGNADSWPKSVDDSDAKKDWGWKPEFDITRMTEVMIKKLREKFGQGQ